MIKFIKIVAIAGAVVACILGAGVGYVYWTVPSPGWSTPSLLRYMNDAKAGRRARWYAAVALKAKGNPAMQTALPGLLATDVSILEDLIPEYLLVLKGEAVPVLTGSLKDPNAYARQGAAFWLGAMARACRKGASSVIEERGGHGSGGTHLFSEDQCDGWHPAVDNALTSARAALTEATKDADAGVQKEAGAAVKDFAGLKPSKS